ncbi:non-hydrolyzing UDP-N-acetylglucosamine 2-epimerase [Psychroflexus montanilacus]|uniref:non-hydrolyzing UDP-N-acetylglucosamine 2-epimerase n=1 Tax=Psychroflexus montanilacus TaxID=2873598 RepID=UPI001CCAE224|nr:UDP-N-acetylglucosamine 2-epimerase (non-hydrolyzing) [Psychroflexus montanilacus]MBZ9652581.1 UDP-N-acetylglucosamine 2-epimerase (non-hydrolyzing) [Psychroflexus montanilacus]
MNITLIAGARPNFMKIAPIIHAIKKAQTEGKDIQYRLVHTGQHYDEKMSETFFKQLNIPKPDVNLECGGGSQAQQTAAIMLAFENELLANPTDLVMVVGDVTSTMACSIVAKKLNTKVAHVEAGIRSWDRTMPEEINRMLTDSITDYFFTTSTLAGENLLREGHKQDQIHFVGNVMIDTLRANESRFQQPEVWNELNLKEKEYLVMTMHRPANVDEEAKLKEFISSIDDNTQGMPVVFPIHPRTKSILKKAGIQMKNIHLVEPLGYLEFNYLVKYAKGVLTDSGGITEETTVMNVPCITLRDNTERPETIDIGTNELIGTNPQKIKPALEKLLSGNWKQGQIPEKWDGKAAERIVEVLNNL